MEKLGVLLVMSMLVFAISFFTASVSVRWKVREKQKPEWVCFAAGLLLGSALFPLPRTLNRVQGLCESMSTGGLAEDMAMLGERRAGLRLFDSCPTMSGWTLTVGFLVMLVFDHVSWCKRVPSHVDVRDLANAIPVSRRDLLTVGVTLHALADGVRWAYDCARHHHQSEMVLFSTMTLHQVPSVFGLSMVLRHENDTSKTSKMRRLVWVSLAAPVASVATFVLLTRYARQMRWLNECLALWMVFSAGSFLYVSLVEVLPSVYRLGSGNTSSGSGGLSEIRGRLSMRQLLLLIGGHACLVFADSRP